MEIVEEVGLVTCARGVIAKGPNSSLGGVRRGSGSEDIHMEEEKVEVKVQEEEVEGRETHGREQGEDRREREQTITQVHDTWMG